jgi:hypothetical protein
VKIEVSRDLKPREIHAKELAEWDKVLALSLLSPCAACDGQYPFMLRGRASTSVRYVRLHPCEQVREIVSGVAGRLLVCSFKLDLRTSSIQSRV